MIHTGFICENHNNPDNLPGPPVRFHIPSIKVNLKKSKPNPFAFLLNAHVAQHFHRNALVVFAFPVIAL